MGAQPLTTEQCELLAALLDQNASVPDRTTDVLAKRLSMSRKQVAPRLEELQARSPPLVRLIFDETWHVQTWLTTADARQAYDEGCRT
jgi:hypothetical protein